jgi:integrase
MNFLETLIGRPNTLKTYRSLFNNWILPEIPDPQNFTQADYYILVKEWQHSKLDPRSIKQLSSLTNRYIIHSGGKALDTKATCRTVLRSKQEVPVKALTKCDLDKLLSAAPPNLYPLFLLGSHAGLRIGEAFGIHWEDVNLLKGTITIKRSYNGPTKNGKTRTVPLSKKLESVFLDLECFKTKTGQIFKTFNPNPELRGLCKKIGIPEITFHNLRHSFATLALESGKSPKAVQQILGHSQVSTTIDLYWSDKEGFMSLDFL